MEKVLAQLHRLPAIPAVVQQVVASLTSDIGLDELTAQIGHDQVLTARLLRVANSSFYGFPRKVASLHDAVVVMGLAGVRSMALSIGFVHAFANDGNDPLDRTEYWKRCFRIAGYARAVAKCVRQPQEIAFTAGMLHDIGQLVLAICLPDQYAEAVARAQADGSDLIAAEEAVLGFHHGMLGAEVARRWNFPPEIEQAIRDCRSPRDEALPPLSAIVCMAICLDRGNSPASILAAMPPSWREDVGPDGGKLAAAMPDRNQLEAGMAGLLA